VSSILSIWFHQQTFFWWGVDRSKFKWLPHLVSFNQFRLSCFFHFIPSYSFVNLFRRLRNVQRWNRNNDDSTRNRKLEFSISGLFFF
jgi:hypothetical protein